MNRGTVMEIRKNAAVVLTPGGEFLLVKANGVSVGEEITWTEEDRIPALAASSSVRTRRRVFSVASVAVLLLAVIAIWSMRPPAVVAYVSMDINPSLELGLDARERVLELRAVNADAEAIVQGISYRGKPVEEVMREVAQKLASAKLLGSGNEEIVIASVRVRSVDDRWETQVTEKIKQVLQQTGIEASASGTAEVKIETVSLPAEVRKEAVEKGISSGKMAIWLAAEKSGREVPLAQIREQSVESISSSIGGLKHVLEEGRFDKDDKDAWKRMLAEQKEERKQKKEERKNRKPDDAKEQTADSGKDKAGREKKYKEDKEDKEDKDDKKAKEDKAGEDGEAGKDEKKEGREQKNRGAGGNDRYENDRTDDDDRGIQNEKDRKDRENGKPSRREQQNEDRGARGH